MYRRASLLSVAAVIAVAFWSAPGAADEQQLLASDGVDDDYFGESVGISGNSIIIGAPYDDDFGGSSGSAYIFRLDGGSWVEHYKLNASDGEVSDWFGEAVAIDGDWAVVGATLEDEGGTSAGAAYVFFGAGGVWSQDAKLMAADIQPYDHFGTSVAISDETIVVGVPDSDDAGEKTGSAYVFVRDGSTWTQQAKLLASDADSHHGFGSSVAVSGDTVVVGAPDHDEACVPPNSLCESGAAYVFTRSGTNWSEAAKLLASDAEEGDYFGWSVAADRNQVLVSAHRDDDVATNAGAVYVFTAPGWGQSQKITADDGETEDRFGGEVAISGHGAIIGAHWDDDAGLRAGAVYTCWHRGTWTDLTKTTAPNGVLDDEFGETVDMDGVWAVVGTHYYDYGLGAAYVYRIDDLDPTRIFSDNFEAGNTTAWTTSS